MAEYFEGENTSETHFEGKATFLGTTNELQLDTTMYTSLQNMTWMFKKLPDAKGMKTEFDRNSAAGLVPVGILSGLDMAGCLRLAGAYDKGILGENVNLEQSPTKKGFVLFADYKVSAGEIRQKVNRLINAAENG